MRAGRDAGYMDLSGHVVEIERPTGLVGCLIEPRDQRMNHWRRVATLPALMQACASLRRAVCVCVCVVMMMKLLKGSNTTAKLRAARVLTFRFPI